MKTHIDHIQAAIEHWLQPDNTLLSRAIDRTVEEGLFSLPDIRYQVRHLKNSLTTAALNEWENRSGLMDQSLAGRRVLCLHAGNLPLAGLQDLLAVLLTGAEYVGKISKKDPYLLPSFLESCREIDVSNQLQYSTGLLQLKGVDADAVLFAGSEQTARNVNQSLHKFNLAKPEAPRLMRTAHFSIAWITDSRPKTMKDLTEAVFRYGGTGCRSAALVVAPFPLHSQKCEFTDYIESFWLENPQHQKPPPVLFYRYAANKAVGIDQAWLDDFLIEETDQYPDRKFLLHWVKGGIESVKSITERYSNGLQTIYTNDERLANNGSTVIPFEPLSEAQTPPVWWKPDGIDTIGWLQQKLC